MKKLLTLAGEIVFRIAFAGLIFVQLVLVVLVMWGISEIFSEDNYVIGGIVVTVLLASPFLIGANSYFLYRRFTRAQYVLTESERWLTERKKWSAPKVRRRSRIRRWALWLPAVSVLFFCLFLDETWPPVSHLFFPTAGRLIGYRVPVPLTWAIVFSEPGSDSHSYSSYVSAFRSRRLFRGSVVFFFGKIPSVSVSSMNFYGSQPSDDIHHPWRPEGKQPNSGRSFKAGNTDLNCEELELGNDQELTVQCTTPHGDLSCNFSGNRRDSVVFYATLEGIKKTN